MTSVADVAETAPTTTTGEGLRADNLALAQTVDQRRQLGGRRP